MADRFQWCDEKPFYTLARLVLDSDLITRHIFMDVFAALKKLVESKWKQLAQIGTGVYTKASNN